LVFWFVLAFVFALVLTLVGVKVLLIVYGVCWYVPQPASVHAAAATSVR
jgi:hypothetical protein